MNKARPVLLIFFSFSLFVNAAFIVVVTSAFTGKGGEKKTLVFSSPGEEGKKYLSSSVIVSIPQRSGEIVFNAVEITLKKGEKASLQFSAIVNGNQANWIMETIYDHKIIEVEKSGYGLVITALDKGETIMQTLTDDGFKDAAIIKVVE